MTLKAKFFIGLGAIIIVNLLSSRYISDRINASQQQLHSASSMGELVRKAGKLRSKMLELEFRVLDFRTQPNESLRVIVETLITECTEALEGLKQAAGKSSPALNVEMAVNRWVDQEIKPTMSRSDETARGIPLVRQDAQELRETLITNANKELDSLLSYELEQLDHLQIQVSQDRKEAVDVLQMSLVLVLVVPIMAGYFLWTSIRSGLSATSKGTHSLSRGDLTTSVSYRADDEFGTLAEAFKEMHGFLKNSLRSIKESAGQAVTASLDLASTTQEQDKISSRQVDSVIQIVATLSEIGRMAKVTCNQSEKLASTSKEVLSLCEGGLSSVERNVKEMDYIKSKIETLAVHILDLSEQTMQIGSIVSAIAEMSNQTNLLALNAAVEAARAGEHGRGFGVVALEIRRLADQARSSTERISGLVEQIQRAINASVLVTEDGAKRVEAGLNLARQAGEVIRKVVSAVEGTDQVIAEVTVSSKEQFHSLEAVSRSTEALKNDFKEAAARITQLHRAAQVLKVLGDSLGRMVDQFHL